MTASSAVLRPDSACVLALGVSGDRCTVALRRRRAGTSVEADLGGPPLPGRSGQILGLVRQLCALQEVNLGDVDVVAFDAGPGGFTALRVACGVAQGLGFALQRPVLPVGSLAALAWQAAPDRRAFVAVDARMGEVYCAVYDRLPDAEPRAVMSPTVVAPEVAVQLFERYRVGRDGQSGPPSAAALGDGFARHPLLAQWCADRTVDIDPDAQPHARAIAAVAELGWFAGRAIDPALAAPLYVRDKVALDVDEQAAARASASR